jgi:hypothetical protein
MLLLLLLIDNFKDLEKYCYFYFMVLQTDKERAFFLENFKNKEIKLVLEDLSNLFIHHPFNAQEIENYMSKFVILNTRNQRVINKYHLSFLRSIVNEYTKTSKSNNYDLLVKSNNESFLFIVPKTELNKELLYMDLYYQANKEEMNKQQREDFMFKRLLKASFGS